jgi:hypothetical protein
MLHKVINKQNIYTTFKTYILLVVKPNYQNYRLVKGVSKNSYRCTSRTDTTPCSSTKSLSMNLIDSAVWSLIKADLPSLSKQINEINPDEYIAQMDNQLINLINREKNSK